MRIAHTEPGIIMHYLFKFVNHIDCEIEKAQRALGIASGTTPWARECVVNDVHSVVTVRTTLWNSKV
jgi:hypothetical protein